MMKSRCGFHSFSQHCFLSHGPQRSSRTNTPTAASSSVVCVWMDSAALKLHRLKALQQPTVFPFPSESMEAEDAAPLHVALLAHCFTMDFVEPEEHTHVLLE